MNEENEDLLEEKIDIEYNQDEDYYNEEEYDDDEDEEFIECKCLGFHNLDCEYYWDEYDDAREYE